MRFSLSKIRPVCFLFVYLACFIQVQGAERILPLKVKTWGYQLQKSAIFELRQESRDIIVLDYLLRTDPFVEYQKRHIRLIKQGKNPNVKLLAYLSIGEAEDYRPYWKKQWKTKPPAWLGVENKAWKGNYKVRYWAPEWQSIMLKELDRILKAGFDGVYMDIVDGFEYWADLDVYRKGELEKEQPGKERKAENDPAGDEKASGERMIQFLELISRHARSGSEYSRTNFLLFPQNGERLLEVASGDLVSQYWKLIDGIGVEDLFHYGELPENNPLNIQKERLKLLKKYPLKGKVVLSVEYINKLEWVKAYKQLAKGYRFVPLTNVRSLEELGAP